MPIENARARRMAPLDTPSNLTSNAKHEVSAVLTTLLSDMFALTSVRFKTRIDSAGCTERRCRTCMRLR